MEYLHPGPFTKVQDISLDPLGDHCAPLSLPQLFRKSHTKTCSKWSLLNSSLDNPNLKCHQERELFKLYGEKLKMLLTSIFPCSHNVLFHILHKFFCFNTFRLLWANALNLDESYISLFDNELKVLNNM